MTPHYADAAVTVYAGDCLDVLRELPDASVDAVVTDPPYGLEFMGKEWDGANGFRRSLNAADVSRDDPFGRTSRTSPEYRAGQTFQAWCQLWAAECLRVLKPGGHLLAFGGTRTSHRLACAIEDAGFEIRDSIAWLYGSGFPKSLDVSKAIDRAAGAEREVVGTYTARGFSETSPTEDGRNQWAAGDVIDKPGLLTAPATLDAERWQGWGTALKPAHEPVVVARRPLAGTVASNVLAHGTGALNIDATRVGAEGGTTRGANGSNAGKQRNTLHGGNFGIEQIAAGRWPANVVLDEHSAHVLDDEQSGESVSQGGSRGASVNRTSMAGGELGAQPDVTPGFGDTGGASRFFYTAKAASDERVRINGTAHPTVKPLALMRWLVRLVTPPGGVCLDPFAGSGTTVEACILEGFRAIGIEREADYLPLITQRIHRRRDPVEAVRASGDDGGLFDLLDGGAA